MKRQKSARHHCQGSKPGAVLIREGIWIMGVLLVALCTGCVLPTIPAAYPPTHHGRTRENLSLAEAQALVQFKVCLPQYVPSDINNIPVISFRDSTVDPADVYVELRYYYSGTTTLAMEMRQRQASIPTGSDSSDSEVSREAAIRGLLAWQVGWPDVDTLRAQVSARTLVREDRIGNTYYLTEFLEPQSLRANAFAWSVLPVHYTLYSRMTVEESWRVVESMSHGCISETARTNAQALNDS